MCSDLHIIYASNCTRNLGTNLKKDLKLGDIQNYKGSLGKFCANLGKFHNIGQIMTNFQKWGLCAAHTSRTAGLTLVLEE